MPRLGAVFLYATPLIDLALLTLTYIDLSHEGKSNFVHGISAIYIGFTLMSGHSVMRIIDAKFARKHGAQLPAEVDTSSPARQLKIWYCRLTASGISAVLLLAGIGVVGLNGAFWLIYWLVVAVSTVILWWFTGPWLARRRAKRSEGRENDSADPDS